MNRRLQAQGSLWLTVDGQALGAQGRLGLLKAIAQEGSITRAARAFGLSYKAAWDAIDAMNATAREPLVHRVTGGKGGGRTVLTPYGERLVARYAEIEAVHDRFLQHLASAALDLERPWSLLHAVNLKTSARNQWVGEVLSLTDGPSGAVVRVGLPGGEELAAAVTPTSVQHLALQAGCQALVMVKAPAVRLLLPSEAVGPGSATGNHGNRWRARVVAVQRQATHHEVVAESLRGVPWVVSMAACPADVGSWVDLTVEPTDVVVATLA